MSTTRNNIGVDRDEMSPEEKGDFAEAGLANLMAGLQVWHAPLDAMIEDDALLANGPRGVQIRCPDYITFFPQALHEAKYRDFSRTWESDDSDESDDERIYVSKERWADYCQHAEWIPVLLWVYVASELTWLTQSVADLAPVDDGKMTVENERGDYEEIEVWWFSVTQFEKFNLLNFC